MTTIGLTGSLGTGKSTVLGFFERLGALTIDTDKLVHEELRRNKDLKEKIKNIFGSDVFLKGQIERHKLARKVFKSRPAVDKLNALIHPIIKKRIIDFFKKQKGAKVVVVEVPLLFETDFYKLFDVTIGVATDALHQRERLGAKYETGQTKARIRWQLPLDEKLARCDFVIDNNKNKKETFNQVKLIMEEKKWKS